MISRSASRRLRLVGARGCKGWIRQIDTMYLTYSSYIRWEFRIISRYGNLFDRVRISLQWFLGVAVIRDRANKTRLSGSLRLSTSTKRIDSSATGRKIRKTPMTAVGLVPFEGEATYAEITNHQRMIGSIFPAAQLSRIEGRCILGIPFELEEHRLQT